VLRTAAAGFRDAAAAGRKVLRTAAAGLAARSRRAARPGLASVHPATGLEARMDDDVPRLLCGTPELPPGCVALTFDDGPGPRSAELARLLAGEGVPGTFFVLRESVARHGHALGTYRDHGHMIGLHGDRHHRFRSAEHASRELRRCADLVSSYVTGVAWFRPPYGIGDWPVPGFAGPVGWHAHGRDWDITYRRGQTVDACVDAIAGRVIPRRGGIVLLHDFAAPSEFSPMGLTEATLDLRIIEITGMLIERLRAAGLSFTGLPEPAPSRTPESARCPR
jgi:peptidoglycan/xylan/chitin deacetylase (PgdA/CDA1 family)